MTRPSLRSDLWIGARTATTPPLPDAVTRPCRCPEPPTPDCLPIAVVPVDLLNPHCPVPCNPFPACRASSSSAHAQCLHPCSPSPRLTRTQSHAVPLLASPSPLLPCRCSRSAPPRLLPRACPIPRRLALALPPVLASFVAASYSRSSAALLVVASPLPRIADPPPFARVVRGRLVMAALRRATRPRPDFARSGVVPASARVLTGLRPLPASAHAR
nr:proline-rich receptor-like protein kinase PERK2 [Aegilops tauschii subsp. strangulata]